MDVRVYTYTHPRKWRENTKLFDEIKDGIHITATKNMAEGIRDFYRNDEEGEFQHILTIHQFMGRKFSSWNSSGTKLTQYLTLSKEISVTPGDKHLREAFNANKDEVLETIRFLVFLGLEPRNLGLCSNELTSREVFFQQIWTSLEKNDSTYRELRSNLKTRWNREEIINHLNRILENRCKDVMEEKSSEIGPAHTKLVLHGFYFITPEQQVVLKKLQEAGFQLIFMNLYDNRFPNTFNFTKSFISKRFGWTDDWTIQHNMDKNVTVGTMLLDAFEEGINKEIPQSNQITAFNTFFDFLHERIMKYYPIGEKIDLEHSKEVQFIAPNADILNKILIQYYPENFEDKRNLLSYPVGRFILKVHEMLREGRLVLNEEILMSTFSSGWLYDKHSRKNARDYTHELKQLSPLFVNCTDIKEWLERLQELINQYEKIIPLFKEEGEDRVIERIRSPFAKIGHLALDVSIVKQIRSFIFLLEDMAIKLFDVSVDTISISEHFSRLADLIKKYNPINHTVLQKEEERLIEKLIYKLSQVKDEHLFLYEDISQAVSFYLSGKFSDDENAFIKPFIEVDGEAFKKNTKKVYLTGLDEQGLPLNEFNLPWPLQDKTFTLLSESHQVLELHTLRNQSIKKISRYLLFIALEFLPNEHLELSWIRNFLDRIDLKPAIYVELLGLKVVNYKFKPKKNGEIHEKPFDFASYTPDEKRLKLTFDELKHEEILAEYELCPRRFYYGYILSRYPVFSDSFHHQFIFSELLRIIKLDTQQDNEKVIKFVSELFPHWTKFKRNTLTQRSIKSSKSWKKNQGEIIGKFSVRRTHTNHQFPGLKKEKQERLFKEVLNKQEDIMKILKNPSREVVNILEAKPGYNCRFCPHLDYCSEGVYAVDETLKKN
ncbi:hypothetical protein AS52_03658 [Priestia megaterium Q3]|uniref:PD-(D/E)XK endonuclease-like domain-containing protein n=1 Tax=Priestia megaterium Q3 TaxID=1452722 RepID=A0A806TSA9_PRIMG|nr:hypothetical protein [Priestia megaterium]AKP78619.1 hypothetical protein AS52_03658 [Priestia megaterium Q3]